ncbi:MAG: tetratricopeptide repeat protein, partial [bacterium]|nr:tetratricopeptide repeat protein [bacterium]
MRDESFGDLLNNLGYIHFQTGRYEEAERMFSEALKLYEQLDAHPQVATTLANLGSITEQQGRYLAAEKLYKRSIRAWAELRGVEAPELAGPLNDLAAVYLARRQFTKADRLFRRSL